MRQPSIRIKRVYEPPAPNDGFRVLVDRLWPRGVKKETAAIDLWAREAAPSAELRRWFAHRTERWVEFQERYRRELQASPEHWLFLLEQARRGPITLLFAARDPDHNNAVVLRDFLLEQLENAAGND
ncbi:MAG: DUF488 domain-containing protein [Calditrichaeota bacterium]|nr:MAG: DUF488 domain-containing protein [Calditrichota bacterium]